MLCAMIRLSLRTLLEKKEKKEKTEKKVDNVNSLDKDWKCGRVSNQLILILSVALQILNRMTFVGNANLIVVLDLFVNKHF